MYGRESSASCSEIRVVSSQTASWPAGVLTPFPFATSSTIAWLTTSRGPSESVNSSPSAFRRTAPYARVVSGMEEPWRPAGPVRGRRVGDGRAGAARGPPAAVRVVLERVEFARLRTGVERDLRHLTGG